MVVSEAQRIRLKNRLMHMIPRVCKKELPQQDSFSLEAVIGVRFGPDDVILITINETIHNELAATSSGHPFVVKQEYVQTEPVMKPEEEAQIFIPRQEGEQNVLLPQKLWMLLQQGKCRVEETANGQLFTAPASILIPDIVQTREHTATTPKTPSPNDIPDHSYLTSKSDRPQTHPTKYQANKQKSKETDKKPYDHVTIIPKVKRGRPLKAADPLVLLEQQEEKEKEQESFNIAVTGTADIAQLMEEGSIVVIEQSTDAEGTENYLPESVVHTEVVSTAAEVLPPESPATKEYKCNICEKVLGSSRSLLSHKQALHHPPAFKCFKCGDSYPHPLKGNKCRNCWKPNGSAPRPFRCLSCNRVFKHRFLLMRHRQDCVNPAQNVDKEALEKYMIVEVQEPELTEEPTEECPQCKEKFHTRKEMKSHVKERHPSAVQCSGCGSMFDNFTLLKHHKKFCQSVIKLSEERKEPRQFVCQFCGRVYNSNSKLTDHIRGIHQEPSIYCSCGAAFRWRSSLNKHKEKCPFARPEDGKTPRKPPKSKSSRDDHECPHCQASYKSDSGLRSHIQVKHQDMAPSAFRCLICSTFFNTRTQLCKHRERCPPREKVSKPRARPIIVYKCSLCHATFKTKSFLRKHIIGMHMTGKKYACHLCGQKFRWNGGLGRHRAVCKMNNTQSSEIIDTVEQNTIVASAEVDYTDVATSEYYVIVEAGGQMNEQEAEQEAEEQENLILQVSTSMNAHQTEDSTTTTTTNIISVPTTSTAYETSEIHADFASEAAVNVEMVQYEDELPQADDNATYTDVEIDNMPEYIIHSQDMEEGGIEEGDQSNDGMQSVMVFECPIGDTITEGLDEEQVQT